MRSSIRSIAFHALTLVLGTAFISAQGALTTTGASSPSNLPGRGLRQHDFLYCGEWNYVAPMQTIWLFRAGQPAWTYEIPYHVEFHGKQDFQELGDCSQTADGDVAFSTRLGATLVSADKKILWHRDTPLGTELHSIQPLGHGRVLIAENGAVLRLLVIDTAKDTIEKEIDLKPGNPARVHGQLRRARMTNVGTFLVAHMDRDLVAEYNDKGEEIWSYATKRPWSANRLPNGNTLITGDSAGYVHEVDPHGKIVWSVDRDGLAGYTIGCIQDAERLPNGDTVFSNWVPNAVEDPADWHRTAQWIEVNRAGKVVWALRQWDNPNLGPASGIQILDNPNRDHGRR